MKSIVRFLMRLPFFFGVILLLPFLIAAAIIVFIGTAWDRLELWAFYDGDEGARDKDKWRDR